jgi:UTP--glucose-1-phosphate uridylyltransferase
VPKPVRKAIFPVAGLGTRFLPATKAMPKEMLTVVDRPVIQYVVDEAREAGITHFIFVTGRNKSVIEDYFDIQPELEATLRERGRTSALAELSQSLPEAGSFTFTRQQVPLGLGHAIWCARDLIGDEPFAVLLPDMLLQGMPGCLARMVEVYGETGGNVVSVAECDPELTGKYGIVGVGEPVGKAFRISRMIEKPPRAEAPSNLYINGRYIFQPELLNHISQTVRGAGNEIQLTDAMIALAKSQEFFGWRFGGRTFDCGSKAGFFAANFAFTMARGDLVADLYNELTSQTRKAPSEMSVIDLAVDPSLRDLREIVGRVVNDERLLAGLGERAQASPPPKLAKRPREPVSRS